MENLGLVENKQFKFSPNPSLHCNLSDNFRQAIVRTQRTTPLRKISQLSIFTLNGEMHFSFEECQGKTENSATLKIPHILMMSLSFKDDSD